MVSRAFSPHATLGDYERLEAQSDLSHEFCDGEIFAMSEWDPAETVAAGGRRAHITLCVNVVRHLSNALDGTPCRAFTSDGHVMAPAEADDEADLFTFPDASVVCGEAEWGPPADTLVNPTLLVEVLSQSTEGPSSGSTAAFRSSGRSCSPRQSESVLRRSSARPAARGASPSLWVMLSSWCAGRVALARGALRRRRVRVRAAAASRLSRVHPSTRAGT